MSTYSDGVEVGRFRKSSRSSNIEDCVEVAPTSNGGCAVRDSKNPHGAVLTLGGTEWVAFTSAIRVGQFD